MRHSRFSLVAYPVACASVLLVASGLGGCAQEDKAPAHFISVDEGAYLRGEQVSTFDVTERLGPRQAERAELFLDGLRIAIDDLAPFELRWNTHDFADGSHALLLRVHLDDETHLDDEVAIGIDNTPPTLDDLPAMAEHNASVTISAHDNIEIARVEISRGVAGESAKVLTAVPYVFQWPWSCETVALQVRVIDLAGGEVVRSAQVNSIESLKDLDCDQHDATSSGGDDCNDLDATIHPAALEYVDGVDRNCDGAGLPEPVDADNDGVASFETGGGDCNDRDPATHGSVRVLAHRELTVNGAPLTWNPGEAVLIGDRSFWQLILNKGGVVQLVQPFFEDSLTIDVIASGANSGSIAAKNGFVAFGRGNQVVILQNAGSTSTDHSVIDADAQVGRLAIEPPYMGAEYATFQAGTKVWFATSTGGAWTSQLLVDAGEPLAEAPMMSAAPYGVDIVFRTASATWRASRNGTAGAVTTTRIGPVGMASDLAAFSNYISLEAVQHGSGTTLYESGYRSSSLTPVLHFPRRVTGLHLSYPFVYVHMEGLGTQVLLASDKYRRVQMLTDASSFDTVVPVGTAFAGSGHVDYLSPSSIPPPNDVYGDRVDTNCNGLDD